MVIKHFRTNVQVRTGTLMDWEDEVENRVDASEVFSSDNFICSGEAA